jgi:hypothetical protein
LTEYKAHIYEHRCPGGVCMERHAESASV